MTANAVAVRDEQDVDWSVIHAVVTSGDLSGLTDKQKTSYYKMYCESVGVDPVTQPFAYVKLQGGKLSLYALKGAAEQLRQNRKITLRIVGQQIMDGMYVVTAEATLPDGRTDTDIGAVWLPKEASEARANAMMKAITKAKRRVTLSICGLGLNDETEVMTIPGAVLISPDGEMTHPVRELPPAARTETQRPTAPPPSTLPVTRARARVVVPEGIKVGVPNDRKMEPPEPEWSTDKQLAAIHIRRDELGMSDDVYRKLLLERYPACTDPESGKPSSKQLTIEEAADFIGYLHQLHLDTQNAAAED